MGTATVTFAEIVLGIILQGPVWAVDANETPAQRRALYTPVSKAIAVVAKESSNPIETASILIALGQNETGFSRYVLEGRCLDGPPGMRCDYSPLHRAPLSRGPFQVRKWCKAAWAAKDGSYDAILESARCAVQYVRMGLTRCLKSKYPAWEGTFSVYRGQSCADGVKTGSNFKGRKYTRSMIIARQQLRAAESEQRQEFLAYLKQEYGVRTVED